MTAGSGVVALCDGKPSHKARAPEPVYDYWVAALGVRHPPVVAVVLAVEMAARRGARLPVELADAVSRELAESHRRSST